MLTIASVTFTFLRKTNPPQLPSSTPIPPLRSLIPPFYPTAKNHTTHRHPPGSARWAYPTLALGAAMSRMNESDEDLMTRFQMQGGQSSTNASRPPSRAVYGDPNTEAITRVARETEAKCSKLLADAESRILDERNKYQQKEFAMKEDLLKEKSKTNDVTQKKVKDVLDMYRKEAEKSATLSTQHHQTVVTNIQSESRARTDDLAEKVRTLERQLGDRERELETMERRNAEEKKELLALRTGQLRLESSRKGGEGEMVNRAMATIAEYEAAVRKSEAENATRLAEYVDGFTHDWLARAKEFEEHKGRFEAETLEKAFQILRDQESTLAEKEEKMRLRMVDVLTQQSEARMDQEAKLLEQFEKFKMEYKSLQDRDFEARCAMYDRSLEQREMLLFDRLNVERQKVAEAQQRHSEAAEMQRVQALNEAMAQVTVMREQLLADNHRKQEEVHAGLLAQRDIMHQEMVEGERLKTEQMAAMQQKIIDATSEAHRVVEEVKRQCAESEAAVHEKYIEVMNQRNRELEVETAAFKESLERNYFSKLNELTTAQSVEVKRLTDEFLEKQHTDSSEAFKREQEMRMTYDAKTAKFEEDTQKRYKKQLSDAAEAETVLKEQIQTMRKEVADLQAGLAHAQQAAKTREMQLEGKLAKAQRDVGAAKLEAEDTLRAKYEKWLEEATAGSHKNTVDRLEYERMKRDAESVEARCQETVRREREQLHAAREESRAACDRRIAEERNRLERLEADMLERVADMRVELEADVKRREAANQRLFDAERRSLHDEAGERSADERRERQAFEDRVKDQEEARWRAINKELQLSCEERVKTTEIRITERESELNQREAAFRQEKLAHQQKLVGDKQRAEAEEWELRSKLELTIRKEADARLQSERERLQTELDGIRKHAVEQQRAMEEARQQLQRQMEDDRAQAEQEVQARFETLHEQSLKESREAQKARDAAAAEKEASLREKHARALAQADEAHKKECEGLQARLDSLRGDVDAERLAYQQEMKEAFRTREEAIRAETQARIKAEQEALRQKELQMSHDNDRLRLEMEARAREDTQRLFDIRSRSLEETDEERKKAESEFFTRMKAKIEEGDAQARERQKRLEEQMRTFTDKALAEQQRQMSATSSAEAERLQEECTRLRGELAKRRQADQAELSGAVDERVGEYRRQLDREREQERMLAEGLHDKQAAEAQKRAEARVAETTASYEAQLEKLRDALGQEKLQAQKAILAKDEEANMKLEEASRLLQDKVWKGGKEETKSMMKRKVIHQHARTTDEHLVDGPEADVRKQVAAHAGTRPGKVCAPATQTSSPPSPTHDRPTPPTPQGRLAGPSADGVRGEGEGELREASEGGGAPVPRAAHGARACARAGRQGEGPVAAAADAGHGPAQGAADGRDRAPGEGTGGGADGAARAGQTGVPRRGGCGA